MNVLTNPHKLTKAIVESIPATAGMTAFSYGLSRLADQQFREPELLNYLVYKKPLPLQSKAEKRKKNALGLFLHYLPGLGFAAAYEYLWRPAVKMPVVASGATFGLLAGLTGVAIWETTIQLRSKPPTLNRTTYYPHLLVAHMVFGATAALVSDRLSKK